MATVASLVQSWEEEEVVVVGEANGDREVWGAALGWRSDLGAHPGSLAAEAGKGA